VSGCECCMAVAGEAHLLINSVAKFANRLPDESDHKNAELTFLLSHCSKHNHLFSFSFYVEIVVEDIRNSEEWR
jgi:hypothetical protein